MGTVLVGLDQVLVVQLSPAEDIAPVAQVVGTVGQAVPERETQQVKPWLKYEVKGGDSGMQPQNKTLILFYCNTL